MQLFSEDHRYTPSATAINDEMQRALAPIFKRHIKQAISPRELALLGHHAVVDCELDIVLDYQTKGTQA